MLTVKEGFALYLSKRVLAESSVEIKDRAMRLFVEAVGDLPVDEVLFAKAEDFKVWLAKTKSKEAANIYLANFKPLFGWLKARGYIGIDPFETIKLFETSQRRKEIFEPAEIERILRVADLRWQAITMLGLCSLRRSETLNLTKNDLNWQGGYIRIEPKEDGPATWEWRIKNHQAAIVPLPEIFTLPDMVVNLHRILKDLIAEVPFGQPYICVEPKVYDHFLKVKTNGRLTWRMRNCPWQNFTRDWRRLLKRAAVRPKRYQDLRATMPTMMANNNVPITDTQKLMRHKSIQTTSAYYICAEEKRLISRTAEIACKFCET